MLYWREDITGWREDMNFIFEQWQEQYLMSERSKVKSAYDPIVAHQAGAYPGFCSMKRLGVSLLPPGWDASPSQDYPQHLIRRYPLIHLGGERHCESSVLPMASDITQCPRSGLEPGPLAPDSSH